MKLCLISPPTITEFNDRVVDGPEATRLIFQHSPMGVLSLAAVLEQQSVAAEVVDLNCYYHEYLYGGFKQQLEFCAYAATRLREIPADVFGFSTICSSYPLTLRLARAVREARPDAVILLGGPQASVVAEPTLESFPFIDYVVRGEAEETLPRLLNALTDRQKHLELIPGITYRQQGQIVRNPNAPVIEDLDGLPLPAFHLYNAKDCRYMPLEAGRGCPFACTFCSTNDFFRRRFRMKSPAVLVEQMRFLKHQYGISSFDLIHDMFTVDRRKVVAFCEAVADSGEELDWGCSARTDCIDDELIDLMAENGCNGIFFGIDSGSDRMQSLMHKKLDLRDAADRIKRANSRKIGHTVSLIAGFPEETKEDLRATINFIGDSLRHDHATIQLHLLAPLAETPITTEYYDRLIYDDIFSDISFEGWEQDPEERELIVEYPKLFPNFYAVPTRWLDRQYLRELREFLLHGIEKAKWLLVLLHRDSGDLLRVFDEWVAWSEIHRELEGMVDTSRPYYSGAAFPKDLTRFVEQQYLPNARYPHLVQTLLEVESAQFSFPGNDDERRRSPIVLNNLEDLPTIARNVRITVTKADYKRVLRALRRRERFDSIPIEEMPLGLLKQDAKIKVVRLDDLSYELLKLCDGARTINEIARDFSGAKSLDVSPLKASVYGLASLARQGFVEINPAIN